MAGGTVQVANTDQLIRTHLPLGARTEPRCTTDRQFGAAQR
jgi:hypothetical protein